MATAQRLLALFVVCTVALAAVPGFAAADARAGGTVVVGENETVTEDLTVMGGTVVVGENETVTEDLTVMGGTVVVHGTVRGDLTAMGGTVVVRGTVTGDVTALGGAVEIGPGATIGGSLTAAGGTVTIAGRVNGSVTAGADTITLASSAFVGGDLRYDGDLVRSPGAVVTGQVIEDGTIHIGPVPPVPDWVGALYGALAVAALAAVLLAAFPGFSENAATTATAGAGRSLVAGFAVLVLTPIVLVLVALTIVGIPVTILGFVLWAVLLLLGYAFGNYVLGRYALSLGSYEHTWAALLVGVLLVAVADAVPVLGGLVQFLVLLLGVGALTLTLYAGFRDRRGAAETGSDAESSSESGH